MSDEFKGLRDLLEQEEIKIDERARAIFSKLNVKEAEEPPRGITARAALDYSLDGFRPTYSQEYKADYRHPVEIEREEVTHEILKQWLKGLK